MGFVGNIARGFMRAFGDFWFGFSYVFKNYLNISAAITSRVIPLHLLLHFSFKRGSDLFPKCCETTRLALISFLTKLADFSSVVHIFLMLPILLPMTVLMVVLITLDPAITELLVDHLEKKPSITDPPRRESYFFFYAVIIAPVIEEIQYRWFFQKCWRQFDSLTKAFMKNDESELDIPENIPTDRLATMTNGTIPAIKMWSEYEPWVLPSSVLFGMAHLGNHIRKKPNSILRARIAVADFVFRTDGKFYMKYWPILGGIFQSSFAFWACFSDLIPVYQKRGLLASIGAHSAWNLSVEILDRLPLRKRQVYTLIMCVTPLYRRLRQAYVARRCHEDS
jgi:membrane protease YdiL (CAAX protease family)